MREKLKKIFSKKEYIVFLVALIITLASLSYAFFLSTDMFNNNIATTDCFKLTFNDSNDINLDKTYPLSESEGSNLTPYQFTIKNVCKVSADYQVNIETLNTSTLDTEYLRIKLDNNESSILKRYELNTNNVNNNVLEGRNITTGALRANEERTYSLRMWIDENATAEQSSNKEYYGKVTVQAIPNKEVHDIHLAYIWNGQRQDAPPGKTDGYIIKNIECTNGTGVWDNKSWSINISNITGQVDCDLEFEEAVYNNVPKWLATANIDKDYTTLNEVFNDTDTLSTLTSNQTSCDYLKESTEWISDVTSNEAAMTYIGNNDYCGDKLFFDDNWFESIANSAYVDKVIKPLVPNMTSENTPAGYEITGSATTPWKAFDGVDSTTWGIAGGTAKTLNITLPYESRAILLDLTNSYLYAYYGTQTAYLYGSNDLTNWDELFSNTGTRLQNKKYYFVNKKQYKYYKFTSPSSSSASRVNEMNLYGRYVNTN